MGDRRPIGFFDSGIGGLTVLVEVLRRLPAEEALYLGDNARTPYGPRPDEEVLRFSTQCLDALAAREVKAIVVACNTSTAIALPHLRRRYALPILGVVRPGATAAALATRSRCVGVIATQATVRSHAYFAAIKEEDPFVEVYEHATPELVPLVEAGRLDGPQVEGIVRRSLAPLLGPRLRGSLAGPSPGAVMERRSSGDGFVFPLPSEANIDTLLLGCTHYPLLGGVIRTIVGEGIAVIDSATATASALASLLEIHGLAAPEDQAPVHTLLTTGDAQAFAAAAGTLFGRDFAARHVDVLGSLELTAPAGVSGT
jgi:glutamate racemase